GRNRAVLYEANQLDEGWEIVVRCAGDRIEQTTLAFDPWLLIGKLIGEALDNAAKPSPAPLYDMTVKKKPAARPQAPQRNLQRKKPHGLVTTEPGDSAENFQAKVEEMLNAQKQAG